MAQVFQARYVWLCLAKDRDDPDEIESWFHHGPGAYHFPGWDEANAWRQLVAPKKVHKVFKVKRTIAFHPQLRRKLRVKVERGGSVDSLHGVAREAKRVVLSFRNVVLNGMDPGTWRAQSAYSAAGRGSNVGARTAHL